MPLIGWIIYFYIKLALSMMIGGLVLPYYIYKLIKNYKDILQLERQILKNNL